MVRVQYSGSPQKPYHAAALMPWFVPDLQRDEALTHTLARSPDFSFCTRVWCILLLDIQECHVKSLPPGHARDSESEAGGFERVPHTKEQHTFLKTQIRAINAHFGIKG